MQFIADFHIHSPYSRATSKELSPENIDYYARQKGIKVIGTGDIIHPAWFKEVKEKVIQSETGLFRLKQEYVKDKIASTAENEVKFILTTEISNIYKKNGKIRKIHNLIFFPDISTVEKVQQKLSKLSNINSDGRPILGMDSKNLLEMFLNISEDILFVPAHIWTPWFSVLGDKSGFDSIVECFEDLTKYIYAVETGLSSDPPMNWLCSFLDKYTLISNSDAHSTEKLGREANIFDTELSYNSIVNAIKSGKSPKFLGTIEFFPQEGKYHFAGHRKCNVCLSPSETLKYNEICPVCGERVTIGVMNRVVRLADRKSSDEKKNQPRFYSVIPLKEILSEITDAGVTSQQVSQIYNSLIRKARTEFNILLNFSIEDIKAISNDLLAEAIRRMREKEIYIKEGYDGQYGRIKVFAENELLHTGISSKDSLFKDLIDEKPQKTYKQKQSPLILLEEPLIKKQEQSKNIVSPSTERELSEESLLFQGINLEQQQAVEHFTCPALVIAGPGTGKTHVLTMRIANLIKNKNIKPENILAITFTNKAANEIKERLKNILALNMDSLLAPQVSTFHAFGLSVIRENVEKTGRKPNFSIIDEHDKLLLIEKELGCEKKQLNEISAFITNIKQNTEPTTPNWSLPGGATGNWQLFNKYEQYLIANNLFDIDDLIYEAIKLFAAEPDILTFYRQKKQWILIDEYQDINFAQYRMIRLLMPTDDSNLFVIGDPNQAIYGFRGADVKFIKKFTHDYSKAKVYTLKKSYRCSDNILKASSNIIPEVPVLESLQKGVKINIVKHSTDRGEAEFVARTIEKMLGGLGFFSIDTKISAGEAIADIKSLSDFAVLCRLNRQIPLIEKALNDHNIPYQSIQENPFFKEEPIKSVIDVLKLAKNPENRFLKNKLKNISKATPELIDLTKSKSVKDTVKYIVDRYFAKERQENEEMFNTLFEMACDFKDNIDEFMKYAILGTSVDIYRPNVEKVTLMTLHSAKGLEFECVFIVGCEDGLIPYSMSKLFGMGIETQKSNVEEERRLLYVGMTRAKKFLYISYAERRTLMGKELTLQKSPFLDNIEKDFIEFLKTQFRKDDKKNIHTQQLKLF